MLNKYVIAGLILAAFAFNYYSLKRELTFTRTELIDLRVNFKVVENYNDKLANALDKLDANTKALDKLRLDNTKIIKQIQNESTAALEQYYAAIQKNPSMVEFDSFPVPEWVLNNRRTSR